MSFLITSQLVEARQQCHRKAFLLVHGSPEPHLHEYEIVVEERAAKRRIAYLAGHKEGALQSPNPPIVISAGDLQATCDALAHGKKRGQQEPHLVVGTETPSSLDKARLAFVGYVIGQESHHRPSFGVIVPFTGDPKRVKLDPLYLGVSKVVDVLREWARQLPPEPPALIIGKQCQTCAFRDHCRTEAEHSDSLYLLDKMTLKLAAKYHKKGIFTLTQLSYVYRPRRRPKKSLGKIPAPFNAELQALAIREKKIYLHLRPTLTQQPLELFLDIEGIPDQGFDYLIGLLAKTETETAMHSFWADSPDDEVRIFSECLALAAKYPDGPIYHYGSYERRAIERVAEQHGLDCKALLGRMVNVNGFIYGKVYFPVRSNRLKDLGAAVGASWPTPNPSGIQSVAWRLRWEDSGQDEFKAELLAYNQADCSALRLLTAELQSLSTGAEKRTDVDFTNKPKQFATATGETIHRAFQGIITSAHDQYKQRRIHWTETPTADVPKKRGRKKGMYPCPIAQRRFPRRVSRTILVPRARKCPQRHKCALVPTDTIAEQHIIDLAFSRTGCQRKGSRSWVGELV
jgi:predicted RecB family nuclease